MKRSEMICRSCVKFEHGQCRLDPEPRRIGDPMTHWCAQGEWTRWSERLQEMEPHFWGEWQMEEPPA